MSASRAVSVVVRVKNEEAWLRHNLQAIRDQQGVEVEIVVVDNDSTDKSREIAKIFNVERLVSIENYSPGKALNVGVKESTHPHVAILSGHCIPASRYWLKNLLDGLDSEGVAGVYGRQLPLPFSDPVDRNDLFMAFGVEPRIQKKDWFFHNANSLILKEVWSRYRFDEHTSTLEDRLWAKAVLEAGYFISYQPEAAVFHHNGLHRTTDMQRVHEHVKVIEATEEKNRETLPESLSATSARVTAIVPVSEENSKLKNFGPHLETILHSLAESSFIANVAVLAPNLQIVGANSKTFLRPEGSEDMPLNLVLAASLEDIERDFGLCDFYLYANWDYSNRPEGFFDRLVLQACEGGFDTVFGAVRDFGHLWVRDAFGGLQDLDPTLLPRTERAPAWRALYGLGTVVKAPILRSGEMVGGRVGMVPIENISGEPIRRDRGDYENESF